jgi:exodeoxyribonuclease-5
MSLTLSEDQQDARDAVLRWLKKKDKPIFSLFGAAGTGKSTILGEIIAETGMSQVHRDDFFNPDGNELELPNGPMVTSAALAGKAVLVLRNKGLKAQTIHSLIYKPKGQITEEIEKRERQLEMLRGTNHSAARAEIMRLNREIDELLSVKFQLNTDADIMQHLALLIVDEVSMVGDRLMDDVLSFNVPVLAVGDPFQLPPVKDGSSLMNNRPDVLLTRVHRQALESPVLRLATDIREGRPLTRREEKDCYVGSYNLQYTPQIMHDYFDQIICGKHVTRRQINRAVRQHRGFDSLYPNDEDKLICLRNMGDFFNGQRIYMNNVATVSNDHPTFEATVKANFDEVLEKDDRTVRRHEVYTGHFRNTYVDDEDFDRRNWRDRANSFEADYAYAITCHKSQGSEWEKVCVVDDGFGRSEADRRRWLYTAVTRAKTGVIVDTQMAQ